MGMVVQHNMNAINAYNRLNANVAGLKKASEKLASGYRINRAGDDAAGLAISEKMRSQIKGLNQAVRNSQDGINMIQTYEGAAQETHSILQRMKELAVESANGTYDNATDRAAIQLEFDQLNDELNQIADTDFNGTVVLNGGIMADGTVAKNGEFRYADGYTTTVQGKLATDFTSGNKTNVAGSEGHAVADQTYYNKTKADAVWEQLGVDVKDVDNLNVTFMYDGERWVADTVTYAADIKDANGNLLHSKGDIVDGARAAGLTAEHVERTGTTGDGGFKVAAGKDPYTGSTIYATDVVFDEMKIAPKNGDTVTLNFTNSAAITYAPKNAGIREDSISTTIDTTKTPTATQTFTSGEVRNQLGFKLDASINDSAMSTKLDAILTDAKPCKFEAEYADGKIKAITLADGEDGAKSGFTFAVDDQGVLTATLDDEVYTIGTITAEQFSGHTDAMAEKWGKVDDTGIATATGLKFTGADATAIQTSKDKFITEAAKILSDDVKAADADEITITLEVVTRDGTDESNNTYKVSYDEPDGTTTTKNLAAADIAAWGLGVGTAADVKVGDKVTVTYKAATSEKNDLDATQKGKVTFQIDLAAHNFADMNDLQVHGVETPEKATMAWQVAQAGVSQANSFKNSTGVLTYTDNLTLQTGARTKDSVNFAFSYNTDGTADMGNLVANLDLSSRSTGLNTASLSLANQDDANYAIDQIDKAINKTSMVRATFGSIQNRLEHKITNLTTTAENLTEAESSIRDTDMASEMMNYTKFNILQQAAQSMLAQANQQPQSILQLLG